MRLTASFHCDLKLLYEAFLPAGLLQGASGLFALESGCGKNLLYGPDIIWCDGVAIPTAVNVSGVSTKTFLAR